MKLKLRTQSIESLKTTLSLISHLRKFVVLKFTETQLSVILINGTSMGHEPQVWCKLQMSSIFDQVEIQSIRDNTILLEINIELLLQTLKNFDKANSDGLNIRLQRKDSSGGQGTNLSTGRTASLALFYSNINTNTNTINHTFRIPVRILKNTHDAMDLKEPELTDIDLMMRLPNEFTSTYKRLDKFKRASNNDLVTIKTSRRRGGFLGFILEEDGKFKTTISWNDKLEVLKPNQQNLDSESMRMTVLQGAEDENAINEADENEDKEIAVKLNDWRMASKIVATCKTVVFLIAHKEGCVLHCLLDETDDVEIAYYISGVKIRDVFDN